MTVSLNPGEVDIKRFELIHNSGNKINLIGLVVQLDIYESIKSPAIFGTMLVADTMGVADNLLLAYSDVEIEYISYSGVGASTPSVFKFKITSINNVEKADSGKLKTYTVNMVSKALIVSSSINLTENFVDMTHDQMVGVIHQYLKTDKEIDKESTKGIDSVVVSKLKPFQAIDKIRRRAISRSHASSSYCFYENRLKYVFATIENIIAEGKKDPSVASGDRNFFLNAVGKQTYADSDWRTIIGFEHVQMENLLDMVGHGGLKNNSWAFNITTGEFSKSSFDKQSNDSDFTSDSFNLLKTVADELGNANDLDSSGSVSLIPIVNDREIERVEKNSYLKAYTMKLLSNMMNIHIHGDSVLGAGSVINIDFPIISDSSEQKNNKLLSGNYLITQIRHIIIPTGKPKYSQACEVLRTGFIGD
jgi:hypothetical protein